MGIPISKDDVIFRLTRTRFWRDNFPLPMEKPTKLTFSNGLTASALRVHRAEELGVGLHDLGFLSACPTLVLVGGAGGVSDADMDRLRPLFVEGLAPLANALGASVVDGGTDAGVIRLMGQARAEMGATFPLIGVAAAGMVALPEVALPRPEAAPLEPHHTHFVLVPGDQWGDESLWLARVASVLANEVPSVTVLVNGGEIAWQDVSQSVKAGRPVLVIAGSGRVADTLATALRGEAADGRARELAASGLLQVVDLTEEPGVLAGVIRKILS
ncbi:MAG: hypothetical protein AUI36_11900, partial [Cyanobacteria bacterium 13_1_40CM_2_61_4]